MRALTLAAVSVAAIMTIALFDAKPVEARRSFSSGSRSVSSGRSFARSVRKPAVLSSRRASLGRSVSNKPKFTRAVTGRPLARAVKKPAVISGIKDRRTALGRAIKDKPGFKRVTKLDKAVLKKADLKKAVAKREVLKKEVLKKSVLKKEVLKKEVLKRSVLKKEVLKREVVKSGPTPRVVQGSALQSGKVKLTKLPVHKMTASKVGLAGRLGVPKTVKPRLAVVEAPRAEFTRRLTPFVQRPWKKAYFWVAVAGIGYLTVPEHYYDRFQQYVSGDNPDYDECIKLLSYAVIEEEEEVRRVRHPMPSTASYRFSATVEPPREARQACSFEPFVERKWNREFVWVEIPQTGNVTVPEEVYDRFHGKVGSEPPDYAGACKMLVEAAAADTVVATSATTTLDLDRKI